MNVHVVPPAPMLQPRRTRRRIENLRRGAVDRDADRLRRRGDARRVPRIRPLAAVPPRNPQRHLNLGVPVTRARDGSRRAVRSDCAGLRAARKEPAAGTAHAVAPDQERESDEDETLHFLVLQLLMRG